MDTKQLWQATLGELELTLSRVNFTTWFKNTFISTYEEDTVTIGVPNTFTKAWLEKKYHSVILKALQKITENKVRTVIYKVESVKPAFQSELLVKEKEAASQPASTLGGRGEIEAVAVPEVLTSSPKKQAAEVIDKFGLNPRYTFTNFVIGKGNELAQAACLAVANKPGEVYNPLFIYGGVGLGKTHLLQAIGHKIRETDQNKKILYVSSEKFTNDYIQSISNNRPTQFKDTYRSPDVLLIDDIHFLAGKEGTQEAFFHTFNDLHQANKQIVLSSDRPPKAIPALEQRLVSRFEWGMIADISAPDLETRIAILEAKIQEKNYQLAEEIINYLATNIQNNVRELEGALNKIIAHHQLHNVSPNLDETKKILTSLTTKQQRKSLTPKQIINAVIAYYDLDIKGIMGACRKKNLALPRQIIMYLMREEAKSSYPAIGQEVGNRDHTTAMHACLKITKAIEEDEKIKQDIEAIRQRLYSS